MKTLLASCTALVALAAAVVPAAAQWEPRRPVEFVAAGGAGGGTDQFARQVQAAIQKHELNATNVVVMNKGGGSGAEAFVYGKSYAGDDTKLIFGTNNEWLLPMVNKLGFAAGDLTPVAVMAMDEFIVWVQPDAPYKTITDLVDAGKANPGAIKFGGSQSKDVDQTLMTMIEATTGAKFTYVPFKSGAEAATQLAGAHIDANTNNPSESIGQWRAGQVRPLCVMAPKRLSDTAKVAGDMSFADIPTCKEQGLAIDSYQMPRTVFLPGDVAPEVVAYYSEMLKKVSETPEFANYVKTSSQTAHFVSGDEMKALIADSAEATTKQFESNGWLAK